VVLLPLAWRQGLADLGGVGWRRGLIIFALAGPLQGILSASGFARTPLGHGAIIQPGMAAVGGLLLATLVLHEPVRPRRIVGATAIVAGLMLLGAEALTTLGTHALGGDFMFVGAGLFWASFGTLLRYWGLNAQRAATTVCVLSLLLYAPLHAALFGFDRMLAVGFWENVLQIVVQGGFAGALAIHLFARAVILLGAGRSAAFPAMVPATTLLIGAATLGEIPTLTQLAGLAVVGLGFRLVLRP
jgi:drug/metabolite transporter (DMT)-like permease